MLVTPRNEDRAAFVVAVFLLYATLVAYGLLQEAVVTKPFDGELFKHTMVLVFMNRLLAATLSFSYLKWFNLDTAPAVPITHYSVISVANVVATSSQFEALKYVSFPVSMLSKTSKVVPVMVWGRLIAGKRYSLSDYGHATGILLGSALVVATAGPAFMSSPASTESGACMIGMGLLALFLAADGLAASWQDRLFSSSKMHLCNQVLYTTAWSTCIALIASMGTGQLLPAVAFMRRHPTALLDISLLGCMSVASQLVIAHIIQRHGALTFAALITVRQLLSIVLSCVIFGHPLRFGSSVGIAIVFAAVAHRLHRKLGAVEALPRHQAPSAATPAGDAAELLSPGSVRIVSCHSPESSNTASPRRPVASDGM